MSRILVAGLPRSGTTWLAKILAESPGVRYVNEPDNREVDPFAWVATLGLQTRPTLSPGARAPDYRLMWELAFNGGWPESFTFLRRAASWSGLPRAARVSALRALAKTAARRPTQGTHQLVKSVAVALALEWVAAEFDPAVVVVWRHPFNLVPAWIEQGWTYADKAVATAAVRARFENTSVWPPPEPGVRAAAWSACAESVLLSEIATRHDDWIVLSHETQTLDASKAFAHLYERLGLTWTDEVERALATSDRPGSGYATNRPAAEEAQRWRARLSPGDQDVVAAAVRDFEETSPIAAAMWRASPAVES